MGPIPETLPADIGRDFDGISAIITPQEPASGRDANARSRYRGCRAREGVSSVRATSSDARACTHGRSIARRVFGLCIEGKMGGTGNAESHFASSDAFDGRIRMRHLESRSRHSTTTRFHVHAGALACVTTQRVGWRYRSCFATLEITDQSVI